MPDAVALLLAVVANVAGLGWLALSMEVHWAQVRGPVPATLTVVRWLRMGGVCGLVGSLLLCLRVDYASMAALVWCMTLAGAALAIALTLSWRPHWMGLLMLTRLRPLLPTPISAPPVDRSAQRRQP